VRRIVCVGSRLVPGDGAGPAVHDLLASAPLPSGVEVIDGALMGLSLLRAADGAESLVFVDSVSGFGEPGDVLLLDAEEVAVGASPDDHAGGLPALLALIPVACERPPRALAVVGLEAPWDHAALARAADLAVATAVATVAPASPAAGEAA
jgi:hydrogenase maturation protease